MQNKTQNETQFSITQFGKELHPTEYTWDESSKTLTTTESHLILDFTSGYGCTFNTGSYCTFNTGSDCIFNIGAYCTFNTGSDCIFNTGSDCTFNTGAACIFNIGYDCTFNIGYDCIIVRRDVFVCRDVFEVLNVNALNLVGISFKLKQSVIIFK